VDQFHFSIFDTTDIYTEVEYDAEARRIRCIGYIINLSLRAFLLADSKEAMEAVINATKNPTSVSSGKASPS
jgi:hypothetical protein